MSAILDSLREAFEGKIVSIAEQSVLHIYHSIT
jgi:hypothetical protein